MANNSKTTEYLKECMADALLKLMEKKEFSKITVNEIAEAAGVHRTTWFRNFRSKNEVLSYKLIAAWMRYADEHGLKDKKRYALYNASSFFDFNSQIKDVLKTIYQSGLSAVIYDAFYQIMIPIEVVEISDCYKARFYAYGLFGLLDQWVERNFEESTDQMTKIWYKIIEETNK